MNPSELATTNRIRAATGAPVHRLILFNLLLAAREGGWRPAAAPPGFWHT